MSNTVINDTTFTLEAMNLQILRADYHDPDHAHAIRYLLDAYARDPMGGGHPLDAFVMNNLVAELAARPYAFSFLAFIDGHPAALLNGFEGFSTFSCRPLLNIHDIVVHPDYRRRGLSQALLGEVEELAREKGCCKLTLEVLQGNRVAQEAYRRFGFTPYELDPQAGQAQFWHKPLG